MPERGAYFWAASIVSCKRPRAAEDRKSTRLNSSHDQISYAVFCLKKKKKRNVKESAEEQSRSSFGQPVDYQHFGDTSGSVAVGAARVAPPGNRLRRGEDAEIAPGR